MEGSSPQSLKRERTENSELVKSEPETSPVKRSKLDENVKKEKSDDPLTNLLKTPPPTGGASKATEPSKHASPPKPDLSLKIEPGATRQDSLDTPGVDTPTTPGPGNIAAQEAKREKEQEERERMQLLVSNFTEEQLDRYSMYRRAAFPKASVKRIMQTINGSGCSVGQNVVIAMAGIAKVFAGEVVEEALENMEKSGEKGPVKPKHLREAVRKLRNRGYMPKTKKQCPL